MMKMYIFLLEWTAQETMAYKKAHEEKMLLQKRLESGSIKSQQDNIVTNDSIVRNEYQRIDPTSSSSW